MRKKTERMNQITLAHSLIFGDVRVEPKEVIEEASLREHTGIFRDRLHAGKLLTEKFQALGCCSFL